MFICVLSVIDDVSMVAMPQDTIKIEDDIQEQEDLRTAAVLFVENTKGGELAERMRTTLKRIEPILGYRIKVVERSGTPLKLMFPLTKIGGGLECGRSDCRTCTQSTKGENLPPCTKRNVLYENVFKFNDKKSLTLEDR